MNLSPRNIDKKMPKKDSKHLRSKSASEISRIKKESLNAEVRDRKVKAVKVKENKKVRTSPMTKQSDSEKIKKKIKAKKWADEMTRPDPLQVKLKELMELVKGENIEEKYFVDPLSLNQVPKFSSFHLSSGEPDTVTAQRVKLKKRPQSAKLEQKPPKPRSSKRPQSARTETGIESHGKLTERHRTRSCDSLEVITIDVTGDHKTKRNRPPSADKIQRNYHYKNTDLFKELTGFETDSLAWDVDISDCVARTSHKKKRPISGRYFDIEVNFKEKGTLSILGNCLSNKNLINILKQNHCFNTDISAHSGDIQYMDSTLHHCALELQNYVPPSNMATQADMAQRKVMDMRRW